VFKDLQRALAIYAPVAAGDDSTPIKDKGQLIALLKQVLAETQAFCEAHGIDAQEIINARDLQKLRLLDDAVAAIILNDASKQTYQQLASDIKRLFKAIKPDPVANQIIPQCMLYLVLSAKIRELTPTPDISEVISEIDQLLDRSIAAEGYIIRPPELLDLSQLDLDKLRQRIEKQRLQQKRIEIERLRSMVERKITQMVAVNRTRINYLEKFQQMIAEYNAGSLNVEELFRQLVMLSRELQDEEKRSIRENLTEEELTIFDLLTRPDIHLSKKEEDQVKGVGKDLLETLKREKLVLDWRKRQQTRATVRLCIEEVLDHLPEKYDKDVYQQKCDTVYQYVFDRYPTPGSEAVG
jgi:type I restriction enzyme R subunit